MPSGGEGIIQFFLTLIVILQIKVRLLRLYTTSGLDSGIFSKYLGNCMVVSIRAAQRNLGAQGKELKWGPRGKEVSYSELQLHPKFKLKTKKKERSLHIDNDNS